jgi:hypothetical protein
MTPKIEALQKMIELTLRGDRVRYSYRQRNYEEQKNCYCAIGCLLTEDELSLIGKNTDNTTSINACIESSYFSEVANKLQNMGFTADELQTIQRSNDNMTDEGFVDYIKEKLKEEGV